MKYLNLIFAILFFFAFAYETDHDKTPFRWFALLVFILNLISFFSEYIIEKITEEIKNNGK